MLFTCDIYFFISIFSILTSLFFFLDLAREELEKKGRGEEGEKQVFAIFGLLFLVQHEGPAHDPLTYVLAKVGVVIR